MSDAVEVLRGSDALVDVRWRGVGDLSGHTLALLDVSSSLRDRLTVAQVSYDPAVVVGSSTVTEAVVRVSVEGTVPIATGANAFRIQATLSGDSVSTPLIKVKVV
jgi:hypothetical protein